MNFERLVLGCIDADFCKCIINIRWNRDLVRWKALDEIYQIDIPLHLSDRKISAKYLHFFVVFKIRNAKTLTFFQNSSRFLLIGMKFARIIYFFDFLEDAEIR